MTNTFKLGNSSKDTRYLHRIKTAIKDDKTHPRNQGIAMQAHHVISGEGMKRSGLGKKIEKFGYDINLLPNLVFIPCTLQGACHLGVQLHRGNHTAEADQDDYTDDCEPGDYHQMVSKRITELNLPISKACTGDEKSNAETILAALDGLSKRILGLIQNKPREAPLTVVAKHFLAGSQIGCGGVDSVSAQKGLTSCPVERDHKGRQSPTQKSEHITYKSDGRYVLKTGR